MNIRPVTLKDATTICRIYNHYVEHTPVTFEFDPATGMEMRRRITEILVSGYPYFVAEAEQELVGYIYIHTFRTFQAYAPTAELTIYLDPAQTGKGYGSRLFEYFLPCVDRRRFHSLISVITVPNPGSTALHEKFGFRQVAFLKEAGRKFDSWHDVGYWQLLIDE